MDKRQQAAILEFRRSLKSKVRTNWTFQPSSEDASNRASNGGTCNLNRTASRGKETAEDVINWRERTYGSSAASEADVRDVTTALTALGPKCPTNDDIAAAYESDAHSDAKLTTSNETPDDTDDRKRQRTKLKRVKREEEETGWNEGLALWVARRNAWTGAKTVNLATKGLDIDSDDESDTEEVASENGADQTNNLIESVVLPVPAAILPAFHPLRIGVNSKTHSEIYSQMIIGGRSPSVPINLAYLTRALVQGWQDAGEWPPKLAPAEPSIARRKQRGAEAVEDAACAAADLRTATPRPTSFGPSNSANRLPRFKKGVQSVRRAFRLSGVNDSPVVGESI